MAGPFRWYTEQEGEEKYWTRISSGLQSLRLIFHQTNAKNWPSNIAMHSPC